MAQHTSPCYVIFIRISWYKSVIIVFIFILLGKHKIELIEDFMVPPINQELIKNR